MNRSVALRKTGLWIALALLARAVGAAPVPAREPVSRLAVKSDGPCEPERPECSVASALAVLADGGTLELAPGRYPARLVIARDVTIEGAGAGRTVLDGEGAGRVLKVEAGARVTVRGVTFTGGRLDKELQRSSASTPAFHRPPPSTSSCKRCST